MQEGVARLWRGTNAGLALAIPTVSSLGTFLWFCLMSIHYLYANGQTQVGIYLPCYDIFCNYLEEFTAKNAPSMTPYAPLLAGSLARSLACTSCYPIELAKTRMQVCFFKKFSWFYLTLLVNS